MFAPFVCLPVGDLAAYSDGVAGVAVLGNEDAVAAFLHGLFAGDFYGGVQVVFDGVRVVGGDFQDDVRVALDHVISFLGAGCAGVLSGQGLPGPGIAGEAESGGSRGVARHSLMGAVVAGRSVRRAGSAEAISLRICSQCG